MEDNRLLALPNEFPRFTCGKQSFFLRMFRVQMYAFFSKHAALSSWNYCSIFITSLLRDLCDCEGTKHTDRLEMSFFVFFENTRIKREPQRRCTILQKKWLLSQQISKSHSLIELYYGKHSHPLRPLQQHVGHIVLRWQLGTHSCTACSYSLTTDLAFRILDIPPFRIDEGPQFHLIFT